MGRVFAMLYFWMEEKVTDDFFFGWGGGGVVQAKNYSFLFEPLTWHIHIVVHLPRNELQLKLLLQPLQTGQLFTMVTNKLAVTVIEYIRSVEYITKYLKCLELTFSQRPVLLVTWPLTDRKPETVMRQFVPNTGNIAYSNPKIYAFFKIHFWNCLFWKILQGTATMQVSHYNIIYLTNSKRGSVC